MLVQFIRPSGVGRAPAGGRALFEFALCVQLGKAARLLDQALSLLGNAQL